MDKLKPIIVHKFWIMAGLALLVPLIGWWLDTGNLAAQITTRRDAVKKAFDATNVPPDTPNDDWKNKLMAINGVQKTQLQASGSSLWEMQKSLMIWPEQVADLLASVPYRGEIPPAVCDLYRSIYSVVCADTNKIVKPYDKEKGDGLVVVGDDSIPRVPEERWLNLPPTPSAMWDAQEDHWALQQLLSAIAAVNGEATSILDAPIRVLQKIELRGGSLKAASAAPGGGGAVPAGAGDAKAGPAGFDVGGAGAMPGRGGGAGGGAGAAYDSKEDFGSQEAGGGGGDKPAEAGPAGAGAAAAGFARDGGGSAKPVVRYLDEDPNLPYKLRGFVINVTMDHRKVPELLVQLSNLKYPVSIIRVHQVAKFDDPIESRGGVAPRGGAAGLAGAEAMGFRATRPAALPGAGFPGGDFRPRDGAAGAEGQKDVQTIRNIFDAAMNDSYLADVTIAGVMTFYQPPKEQPGTTPGQPASPQPGQPASPPGTTPGQPATPAPTAEGTTPTPADGKTADEKPADEKPADEKPAAEKPTAEKPPDEAKPEAPKADAGKPDKPEPAKPEGAAKPPEPSKPETAKPETAKPADTPAPEKKPEAAKPGGTP